MHKRGTSQKPTQKVVARVLVAVPARENEIVLESKHGKREVLVPYRVEVARDGFGAMLDLAKHHVAVGIRQSVRICSQ